MNLVIFSGTTEGRLLSEFLSEKGVLHQVCVATASGENVMTQSAFAIIRVGRMDCDDMENFFTQQAIDLVVDATHPYARQVTKNLRSVCEKLSITYLRVKRNELLADGVSHYSSPAQCADFLSKTEGNILLATGSKELEIYTADEGLRPRIFVRVLPTIDAIGLCQKAGIEEKNIIAMYGPHSLQMNEAILKQYNICHMVTKSSGANGGFEEKIKAAKSCGVRVHLIDRPKETEFDEEGISLDECKLRLLEGTDKAGIDVSLIGIGMGHEAGITLAAKKAMDEADLVFGAERMLASYEGKGQCIKTYKPEEILGELENRLRQAGGLAIKAVVLFSGDTGIYSGASKLYKLLNEWGGCESIKILPGISSFSAFSALLGVDYAASRLESLHGKSNDVDNIDRITKMLIAGEKVFLLMSGKADFLVLKEIMKKAFEGKWAEKMVDIGYNISYPSQLIKSGMAGEIFDYVDTMENGLFIVRLRG